MPLQRIDIEALLLQQEMCIFVYTFDKLLQHSNLLLDFVSHLELSDLMNLYSIHREFHAVANQNLTSIITSQGLRLCPESFRIFHFSEYPMLCIPVAPVYPPIRRPGHHEHRGQESKLVLQPTLRWLNMVLHRDKAITDIISALSKAGHRLLPGSHAVLKKMWRIADAPTSAHRMALLRNQYFFADRDLRAAILFLVKLDMCFSHPVSAGTDEIWPGLRELFINQRSPFAALRDYLVSDFSDKSRAPKSEIDVLQMFLEASPALKVMVPADDSAFGIPHADIGKLSTTPTFATLIRIDELVLRESIRRRMELHVEFLGMILYGNDLSEVEDTDIF